MAEETEEVVAAPPPVKASGGNNTLMIILLVLLSNGIGLGVTWYMLNKTIAKVQANAGGAEAAPVEEDIADLLERGAVVPLEPFVVNLADIDAPRYLRIKVSLMVDDKAKIAAVTENQALQLKVRDVILQTLTRKTSKDLISDEGKNQLRSEIKGQVEIFFKDPKLMDVMFTEFVIQL